jgi:hypothetical protein
LILTAHQPLYLGGYLGTIEKVSRADVFCIFDAVQFVGKGDFIQRNRIRTKDGWIWLTVPIIHTGERQLIRDVRIDNRQDWRRKHLRAIELNYARAPYLDRYIDFIRDTYSSDWEYLSDLDTHIFLWVLSQLGIKVAVVKASDYKFTGSKSALVLDMCQQLGVGQYWFGEQGRNYCDTDAFRAAGVEPHFQQYRHPVYRQCWPGFEPFMCALDLLLNEGPRSLEILTGGQG